MDILSTLENSPALIAAEAEKVANARKELDTAKHRLEVERANATIRHAGEKNQSITNARVDADDAVQKAEALVIDRSAAYEIAKIQHDKVSNDFIASRKLAAVDEAEWRAIRGSTIHSPQA